MNKFRMTYLLSIPIISVFLAGCFAIQQPEAISNTLVAPTVAVATTEIATEAPANPVETTPVGETTTAPDAPAENPSSGAGTFAIDGARSEVRFSINEQLMGSPKTVLGVNNAVAGQVVVDYANPSSTQIGEILVNSRGFTTDNNFRNNAIANKILLSNAFETISFKPTSINGLPASLEVGQSYAVQVTGDLTIIGTTLPVTFDVTLTVNSERELQGSASSSIEYPDFKIEIPFSPSVDSVETTVKLELDFVAVKQ
ncbi:MAG TPA: YceI family protein [Anaerolineales bacterium]|nr:YceI family protein [Anaerolineales bacterium]